MSHVQLQRVSIYYFFFFNDTATTEIYTLSLHDALPISVAALRRRSSRSPRRRRAGSPRPPGRSPCRARARNRDRKSTRLNSSHSQISYAVFCLKKKKNKYTNQSITRHRSISTTRLETQF